MILAVPRRSQGGGARLLKQPDEVPAANSAESRRAAVGFHYRDFRPTTDDEVMALLAASAWWLTIDRPVAVPGM